MAITVNHPRTYESLLKDSSFYIEWADPTGISWDIDLYKSSVLVYNIVTGHTGALVYEWKPPVALLCDDDYTIKVTNNASDEDDSEEFIIYANHDHYVYHIDKDRWTKFVYIDLIKAVVLSGGNTLENINLLLDSANEINKYPGASYTSEDAQIKTKKFYMSAGVLKRVKAEYEGSPQIFTRVWNRDYGSPYYAEDELTSIETEKFQTVENGKNRGSAFEVIIKNATRILKIIMDAKPIGRFKGD
jgi:hypothetical protein